MRRCLHESALGPSLEAVAGPVRMRVFTQFATGDTATMTKLPGLTPLGMMRFGLSILGGMLSGRYRHTPFFDQHGQPVATAHRVDGEERAKLPPYARASG